MSAALSFLEFSVVVSLALLTLTFLLAVGRVVVGPTLPDRIVGLDMLVGAAIGYIAVIGVRTGYSLYLDIAIALGLVGFLATIAFARFVLERGMDAKEAEVDEEGKGAG